MRKIVILTILIVLLFSLHTYAGIGGYTANYDEDIDQEIREEMHLLNQKIVDSINNNQPSVMIELAENKYLQPNVIKSIYSQLSIGRKRLGVSDLNLELFHDFYVKHSGIGAIPYKIPVNEDQFFIYGQTRHDAYLALYKTNGLYQDSLITLYYMKLDKEWKVLGFHIYPFDLNDKTPYQWFQEAKEMAENADFGGTSIRLQLTQTLMSPSPLVNYTFKDEYNKYVEQFNKKINEELEFPYELSFVDGQPQLYGLQIQFVKEGWLPVVLYKTSKSFTDETGLEKEAELIYPLVKKILSGIEVGTDYVVFRAFQEPPTNPKKEYNNFATVIDVSTGKKLTK